MQNNSLAQVNARSWFYIFLVIHVICWTIVPVMVRLNLPLDTIEGIIWANQLQLGYDKDPFLNGWLSALAIYLGGQSGWMTYLFCQLSVGITLWCVWQTASRMLSPVYALISVLVLEGVQYFNLHALDFNDNTLELGLWGLTTYCFYRALTQNKAVMTQWLLTGLFAGLAMMAKYYTLALLAGMVLFLLLFPANRKHLKTLAPYLGLFIFSLIVIPHIVWLFSHDFITVRYVFNRASSIPSWTNHFYFPTQFAWQQIQVFLPALLLFCFLLIGKKPILSSEKMTLSSFNKSFLLFVCLGPFLLTIILSLLSGIKLRAGWGMPLLSFWGVMLVAGLQPYVTKAKLYRFIASVFLFMALLLGGYVFSLTNATTTSTANFPGKEVAKIIAAKWQDLYHTQLAYVAGSRWVGGNIQFYSDHHPSVFIEWDAGKSPWINEADLRKKGAVFIWEVSEGEKLPKEVRIKYPELQTPEVMTFEWQRKTHEIEPVRLGVAILPPGVACHPREGGDPSI